MITEDPPYKGMSPRLPNGKNNPEYYRLYRMVNKKKKNKNSREQREIDAAIKAEQDLPTRIVHAQKQLNYWRGQKVIEYNPIKIAEAGARVLAWSQTLKHLERQLS